MSDMLIEITDWNEIYENATSRKIESIRWVPVPNKHDGEGYAILVERPDGAAMLGAWLALLQVASKCEPRGILARRDGSPLPLSAIAAKTRLPVKVFEKLIPILRDECKWINVKQDKSMQVVDDYQPAGSEVEPNPTSSRPASPELNGMEWKGMEGNPTESCAESAPAAPRPSPEPDASPVVLTFPCTGPVKAYDLTQAQVARWQSLFETVDVPHECRMALAWIEANPTKRKTAGGMPKFLTSWLTRATNDPRKGTGGGIGIQYRKPGPMRPQEAHTDDF